MCLCSVSAQLLYYLFSAFCFYLLYFVISRRATAPPLLRSVGH